MQLQSTQTSNQPIFKGRYLIQISKKAFAEPANLEAAFDSFHKATAAIAGESQSPLSELLKTLGFPNKSPKVISILESPLFIQIQKDMKEANAPSNHWFRHHIGSSVIPVAKDEQYHSFTVLTKQDKDQTLKMLSGKTIGKITTLARKFMNTAKAYEYSRTNPTIEQVAHDRKKDLYWIHATLDETLSKGLGEAEKSFKIEDLSQLPKVFEEIDY